MKNFVLLLLILILGGEIEAAKIPTFLIYYNPLQKVKNGKELDDSYNGYNIVERRKIYASFAIPLAEDLKTYTWGRQDYIYSIADNNFSDDYIEQFFQEGTINDGRTPKMMGGTGIYVAKDPASSQKYGTSDEFLSSKAEPGSLVEITLHKGTPFLSLNNTETVKKLHKAKKLFGMDSIKQVLYDLISVDPPIVFHYHRLQWYVVKTNKTVTAKILSGKDHDLSWLLKTYKEMEFHRGRRIFIHAIKENLDSLHKDDENYLTMEKLQEEMKDYFETSKEADMPYILNQVRYMDDINLHTINKKQSQYYVTIKNPGFAPKNNKILFFTPDSNPEKICHFLGFSSIYQDKVSFGPNTENFKARLFSAEKKGLDDLESDKIISEISCIL